MIENRILDRVKRKLDRHGLTLLPGGRVKIPSVFADLLGCNKSTIVRANQGTRGLSHQAAMQVVDLFSLTGHEVHITEVIPSLKPLRPYICQPYPKR